MSSDDGSGDRAAKVSTVPVATVAGVLLTASTGCGAGASDSEESASTPASAVSVSAGAGVTSADTFLSGYVTDDGRVLRHDQGADVVSEGQAYGMLVAELAGRPEVVRTIWTWTRDHLGRSDGLLAYHADQQGQILDPQAASDADTLAAYALLRYDGTGADALHRDGRALATAVLKHETVRDGRGGAVLAAGPWATGRRAVVDPSYLMPSVFTALARLTRDSRWNALAHTSVDLVDQLTDHGGQLPSDWARLDGDRPVPTGNGGGGGAPQYGPDAQRVPMWFAAGCDARSRHLAGTWWTLLQQDDRSSATALSPVGDPIDPAPSTVALLAAEASARAAGDDAGAANLERGAQQTADGHPTYYGDAWLVLAAALRDGRLTTCSCPRAASAERLLSRARSGCRRPRRGRRGRRSPPPRSSGSCRAPADTARPARAAPRVR